MHLKKKHIFKRWSRQKQTYIQHGLIIDKKIICIFIIKYNNIKIYANIRKSNRSIKIKSSNLPKWKILVLLKKRVFCDWNEGFFFEEDISVVEEESVLLKKILVFFVSVVNEMKVNGSIVYQYFARAYARVLPLANRDIIVYQYFARAYARVLPLANRDIIVVSPTWVAFAGFPDKFPAFVICQGLLVAQPLANCCTALLFWPTKNLFFFIWISNILTHFATTFVGGCSWQICQEFSLA